MKGQEGSLVYIAMVAVSILAMVSIFQVSGQLENGYRNTIRDLENFAKTEAKLDAVAYNYVPMAVKYSVYDVAHGFEKSIGAGTSNIESKITSDIENSAETYFSNNYRPDVSECDIDIGSLNLDLKDTGENASISITSDEEMAEIKCGYSSSEIGLAADPELETETRGFRLFAAIENFKEVENKFSSQLSSTDNTGSGSVSTICSYSSKSSAKSAARSEANSDISSGLSSIESRVLTGLRSVQSADGFSRSYRVDSSDTDSEVSNVDSSVCCHPRAGTCSSVEYNASADYSYTYNSMGVEAQYEGSKYSIPVSSGWKNLKINLTVSGSFSN